MFNLIAAIAMAGATFVTWDLFGKWHNGASIALVIVNLAFAFA